MIPANQIPRHLGRKVFGCLDSLLLTQKQVFGRQWSIAMANCDISTTLLPIGDRRQVIVGVTRTSPIASWDVRVMRVVGARGHRLGWSLGGV